MEPKEIGKEEGKVEDGDVTETVAKQKETIDKLTAEIQEVRKSRREDREALDALLKAKEEVPTTENDPKKIIDQEFAKREAERLKEEREEAEREFKMSQKEFNPDNDPGEIKYQAFLRELNKFNLQGIKTKQGFSQIMKEAYEFMNRRKSTDDSNLNSQFAAAPRGDSGIKVVDDSSLSKAELTLIKNKGWDTQRYLKLKQKQPAYVSQLLRYVQN
jgi:hypothetical protein